MTWSGRVHLWHASFYINLFTPTNLRWHREYSSVAYIISFLGEQKSYFLMIIDLHRASALSVKSTSKDCKSANINISHASWDLSSIHRRRTDKIHHEIACVFADLNPRPVRVGRVLATFERGAVDRSPKERYLMLLIPCPISPLFLLPSM